MKMRLYVGTYTIPIVFGTGELVPGRGRGIHILELDTQTGALREEQPAAAAVNPSFLAMHPNGKTLYAVNELKEYEGAPGGSVSAFAVTPGGGLRPLNTRATGGQDPCHLSLSRDGSHLVAANFMTGSVCVYVMGPDGSLGEHTDFLQHEGSGPDKARQAGPHAHAALFDPAGRYVLVPDLGLDKLMAYRLGTDGRLRPAPAPWFACAPGAGPRSGEFHPALPVFYCINELGSSVSVLRYDAATASMEAVQTVSSLPEGCAVANTCADLHVSRDGRFVYSSNRGHDSLMVYAADPQDGTLTSLGTVPTGGRTPRQFALAGDFLLVGNQDSDNITVFARDSGSGLLEQVFQYDTPMPVCILPAGEIPS